MSLSNANLRDSISNISLLVLTCLFARGLTIYRPMLASKNGSIMPCPFITKRHSNSWENILFREVLQRCGMRNGNLLWYFKIAAWC
ncbi:hypothetical protein CEV34_5669 [Brucella pseudogrignonensis]|uniref:Uncharacterized protein n=1 Tax=Brucella pseudogrignonensis TaxID=419475 RepID=A0A256GD64_9HYPH|nr:hypothetical protein CEV34_5669 [Brucella pseudogrignonensis]